MSTSLSRIRRYINDIDMWESRNFRKSPETLFCYCTSIRRRLLTPVSYTGMWALIPIPLRMNWYYDSLLLFWLGPHGQRPETVYRRSELECPETCVIPGISGAHDIEPPFIYIVRYPSEDLSQCAFPVHVCRRVVDCVPYSPRLAEMNELLHSTEVDTACTKIY